MSNNPVSILYKSIAGRYRPVRVADGPTTARYRFIKNTSWVLTIATIFLLNIAEYETFSANKYENANYCWHFHIYWHSKFRDEHEEGFITCPLRKHAYSNILKISPPKTENFQIKILIFFYISAQNIDCGYSLEPPRRGGYNEYHNLCF